MKVKHIKNRECAVQAMEATDRELLIESTETNATVNSIHTQSDDSISVDQSHIEQRESCFSGYKWKVFNASAQCLVQTLVGASVGVTSWFAFKSAPISVFQLHVGLSVIGYQLLMAHGVLCLRSSVWSSLSLEHLQRTHWILQLSGSTLAIAGSSLMIRDKENAGKSHFNSVHGKLALAALICTCLSLIIGVLSLYAVELRRFIPTKLSKISHIILGSSAFTTSSACLAFGYNKKSFVEWASQEFAYIMIGVVTFYTVAIVVAPCYTAVRRMFHIWKIKIC